MKNLAIITLCSFVGLSYAGGLTYASAANSPGDTCSSSSSSTAAFAEKNIIETALAAGDFNTLAAALKAADLLDTLQGKGPFTVFAPTDAAFAQIPAKALAGLLKPEARGTLTNILTYHVVPGRVTAAQVVKLDSASAINGQRLGIRVNEEGVTIAGAMVTVTDIECSNGIIHIIDTVMMPSTKNIVETAVGAGSFKTLTAALGAAGLAEVLQTKGPFTVFAPTDEAFAALPGGTVESLLKPENRDQLVTILKYHVVAGRVYSDQLKNGQVMTLSGTNIKIDLNDRGAFINESKVATADIDTTNGVIHVINKVLLPQ
jgi:transforming growth factor-beta-induced protein